MSQSSKITVEILRTTANIGKQGEVKEVSLSYAENKLFPEGIAREFKAQPSKEDKKKTIYEKRADIAQRLHEKTMKVVLAHSETIDQDWIVAKIRENFHVTLLPEMIRTDEKHIKKSGKYTIHLDIASDAYAQIILHID